MTKLKLDKIEALTVRRSPRSSPRHVAARAAEKVFPAVTCVSPETPPCSPSAYVGVCGCANRCVLLFAETALR
eukprot:2543531-Prymnesium_polylepis.1